jgi:WD40 repeat protein
MPSDEVHLRRLKESADNLASLLNGASNAPLDRYLDVDDAQAVVLAASIDADAATAGDLERILLVRNGLYEIFQKAREANDGGEYSIDQLINAFSRLYVDLEALLASRSEQVRAAQAAVAEMEKSQQASPQLVKAASNQIEVQASEIISQINVTNRNIYINVLNFSVSDSSIIKNIKVNIKRLSASVFAIKMQFAAGIIFEGVIRFLNEGVDRILKDLSELAKSIGSSFKTASEFLAAIDEVVRKGTRFVKLVGSFIKSVFEDEAPPVEEHHFDLVTSHRSPALISGTVLTNGRMLFGGKEGIWASLTPSSGQFIKENRQTNSDLRCLAAINDEHGSIAAGTSDGLVILSTSKTRQTLRAAYSERVDAVAVVNWGGSGNAIITGSGDGALRRWSLSGGLTQFREGMEMRDAVGKLGRSITGIVPVEQGIAVSTLDKVFILDETFKVTAELPIDRRIAALCSLNRETLVAVGTGLVAEINLARGSYSRMISVSPGTEYVAVARLSDKSILAGTSQGMIRAIDMRGGAEMGERDLDMVLRGFVVRDNKIVAFGGPWRAESKSLVSMVWRRVVPNE